MKLRVAKIMNVYSLRNFIDQIKEDEQVVRAYHERGREKCT